jgi:hypothetical protein
VQLFYKNKGNNKTRVATKKLATVSGACLEPASQ